MNKLTDYYDALAKHDWYWAFSDDHTFYTRGKHQQEILEKQSKFSPDHLLLYTKFDQHHQDVVHGVKQPRKLPTKPGTIL